ncbi:MAG: hypothetical protein NC833_01630 [Candidatus Omnitrophica bacterium]|nr:hypothetical protein [Candidatus Omnitrophota bacterium]
MDRKILIFIILFIFIFELQYIYLPNSKKVKNLNNLITKKENEYNEFLKLCERYKKMGEKKESSNFKIASQNFSFFSYLNNLIDKTNIRTNISDIKILPKEEIENYIMEKIQIDINLISLEQLLSILNQIEKTRGLYIFQFEIKRDKNKPYFLNVSIGIICLKQKE